MRKSQFNAISERIEKYLSERDRAQSSKEIAEGLEMTPSFAYSTLQLMEVFGTVQKAKGGARYYFFLKGDYDDAQISAMLPPKKVKPKSRRKSTLHRPRRSTSRARARDNFLKEQLSAMRAQVSSFEGPSALAMIGLTQIDVVEENVGVDIDLPEIQEVQEIDVEEEKFETPIMNEAFGTVEHLSKDVRRLTRGQTKHLIEQLKFLEGYERIKGYETVFAKLSALGNKKYGNPLYFSKGTNSWDHIQKVTIDPSISDFMFLPAIEVKRWSSWNYFLTGLKEPRIKYGKDQYDKIIDQFIENGNKLVEITVENRKANYVNFILNKRIGERGLEEQVKASYVTDWVYLEKVE